MKYAKGFSVLEVMIVLSLATTGLYFAFDAYNSGNETISASQDLDDIRYIINFVQTMYPDHEESGYPLSLQVMDDLLNSPDFPRHLINNNAITTRSGFPLVFFNLSFFGELNSGMYIVSNDYNRKSCASIGMFALEHQPLISINGSVFKYVGVGWAIGPVDESDILEACDNDANQIALGFI